jgi:hypothetical protein
MKQKVDYFTCSEKEIQRLNDYIEQGWIVKAMTTSFNQVGVFILFEK